MSMNTGQIESKWKKYWQENKTYKVDSNADKPKYYVLDMFPYPSGAGLHVGHPLGYIASDIYARYKRMMGFNVLHPMGFDSFGLPAEQYAIQTGIHPAISTDQNIQKYKEQLFNLGLNYDWDRQVATSDPSYYKWTQWIFSQLFQHYYDNEKQKASPIEDLVKVFESEGNQNIDAATSQEVRFSAAEWKKMTPKEKDDVLMNYRLAYRKTSYVNWCEELGTVLANDEVKDGLSERGGHPVVKKPMVQWSLRITAYAERLLADLDQLEWSDSLKIMQQNWIGRSEGARILFEIEAFPKKLEVFTTRPDTIFGATFMVMAPEHEWVKQLTTPEQKEEVEKYKDYAANRSEIERTSEKKVTGAFTGAYALNPFTGSRIPIWISEYVLSDYGTGAIMAVPSDDDRDQLFAQKFDLPIIKVIDKSKYPGATSKDKLGIMLNSDFITGMEVPEAIQSVIDALEERGIGSRQVNYKLRDANFSRQRYWGEPFPIIYDEEGVSHLLPESELPVELPPLNDFKPGEGGKSPLARNEDWLYEHRGFTRETDTMPGFAGSSWYFLRYMDPNNDHDFASQEAIAYWKDVDLYIGGTEHAVGHLMYSRFWHKFLYDKGLVPTQEPFRRLVNQGMIQGVIEFLFLEKEKKNGQNVFVCADLVSEDKLDQYARIPVHIDFVSEYGTEQSHLTKKGLDEFVNWRPEYMDAQFHCGKGQFSVQDLPDDFRIATHSEVGKMSKRYFNVVNPDDVVDRYGADCFRMYEMFLGPIEQSKPWDIKGIDGVSKFLKRFWSLFVDDDDQWLLNGERASDEELKILHRTIKKVHEDIKNLSFNTAVSAFMVFVNDMKKLNCHKAAVLVPAIKLIAPFAPFIAEELWHRTGDDSSIHHQLLPLYDDSILVESTVEYPICINGKKRGMQVFPKDMDKKSMEELSLELDFVQKWTEGKTVRKVIIVPGRMVNIVVS
jgi:leucyl-tRNA synthetase